MSEIGQRYDDLISYHELVKILAEQEGEELTQEEQDLLNHGVQHVLGKEGYEVPKLQPE